MVAAADDAVVLLLLLLFINAAIDEADADVVYELFAVRSLDDARLRLLELIVSTNLLAVDSDNDLERDNSQFGL